VPPVVRGLRGATTVDVDSHEHVNERVTSLLRALFDANDIDHDDIISILFGDVPLICARELDIAGGTPFCIRVLVHLMTERSRAELHHVYLEGARTLRDDLPG
jgi:chorismate mutase